MVPDTLLGRWSARLLVSALASLLAFFGFAAAGLRGGASLGDGLWLAGSFGLAVVSALAAGGLGVMAMVARGERSTWVLFAVVVAAVAAFFIGAEILLPP